MNDRSPTSSGGASRRASSRAPLLAQAVAVIAAVLVALNGAAWAWVRVRRADERVVDIQSRDLMRARAATLDGADARQVAFLGDSLVFGKHLEASLGARWTEHTLASSYAQLELRAGRRPHAVNLGINGVLFRELECVAAEAIGHRPALLFIDVSPRPFARDFRADGAASERGLCRPDAHALDRLFGPLRDVAFEAVPLLRYRDLVLRSRLSASPRLAAVAAARAAFGLVDPDAEPPPPPPAPSGDGWGESSPEEAAAMREMAWRVRAAQRYDSIEVRRDSPQAAALRSLVARLGRAVGTRVVLFYLEEDMSMLAEQVDIAHFEQQRDAFTTMVRDLARAARVTFRPVRRDEIGGHYHDHVHLDAEGYLRLASLLRDAASESSR